MHFLNDLKSEAVARVSFLTSPGFMLRPATLFKKRIWHWCFPVNLAKFLGTPFLTDHLRWLLLESEFVNHTSNS